MTQRTIDEVMPAVYAAGFVTESQILAMVCIGIAESSLDDVARNWHNEYGLRPATDVIGVQGPISEWNSTHTQQYNSDRGIFQISSHWFPEYPDSTCDDIYLASVACWTISSSGTNFALWDTYASGAAQSHYDAAVSGWPAVRPFVQAFLLGQSAGGGGTSGSGTGQQGGGSGGPTPGTVGGGGGGSFPPPTTDQIHTLLQGGRVQISRRLEIYESDGRTLWMGSESCPIETSGGGAVSVDVSRNERRTLDVSFMPLNKSLRIGVGGLWYDKLIRVYWGFYYGSGTLWEVPLGDFMIDQVEDSYKPSTIHVTGRDLTKRLIISEFPNTVTFVAGTSVADIVLAEAALSGITNVQIPWTAGTGPTLAFDQTAQADSSRFSSLQSILSSLGYEIFMSAPAALVVRPFQDPATFAPTFTFKTGLPDGNIVKLTRRTNDTELYNRVTVRGSGQNNALVFGSAEVTDVTSPVHKDQIGDRPWPFSSPLVGSDSEAIALATQFLKVKSLESYEIDLQSLVIPWLDAGNVVGYEDPDPIRNEPANYLMANFTIPLGLDSMSGIVKRVVSAV